MRIPYRNRWMLFLTTRLLALALVLVFASAASAFYWPPWPGSGGTPTGGGTPSGPTPGSPGSPGSPGTPGGSSPGGSTPGGSQPEGPPTTTQTPEPSTLLAGLMGMSAVGAYRFLRKRRSPEAA